VNESRKTRSPRTKAQHDETVLSKIVRYSLKMIGLDPGRKEHVSVKGVLAASLVFVMGWAVVPTVLRFLGEMERERNVHVLQDRVSTIERRPIQSLLRLSAHVSGLGREVQYADPTTHEKVMADVWEEGRLTFRNYFDQGKMLSRDSFLYDSSRPSGKKREYFDNGVRVLVEEFSQTGVLLSKHHCRKDDPNDCRDYMRDFRSPLPPSGYVFYR
jgi:hypothetical protein